MTDHHSAAEHGFSLDNDRDEPAGAFCADCQSLMVEDNGCGHLCPVCDVHPDCAAFPCSGEPDTKTPLCPLNAPLTVLEPKNPLARAGAVTAGELVDDWHKAAWMQTFTGRAFRPWTAEVDDIDSADIARSLSMQCRYNGHVSRFYSVAEHAVLMSETFEDRGLALWALLHDAAEAYIGDMVRPLKITSAMQAYRDLDDKLTALVAAKFDLPGITIPPEVKLADNRILLTERAELLGDPVEPWEQDATMTPLPVTIKGWMPPVAELNFLRRLDQLDAAGW